MFDLRKEGLCLIKPNHTLAPPLFFFCFYIYSVYFPTVGLCCVWNITPMWVKTEMNFLLWLTMWSSLATPQTRTALQPSTDSTHAKLRAMTTSILPILPTGCHLQRTRQAARARTSLLLSRAIKWLFLPVGVSVEPLVCLYTLSLWKIWWPVQGRPYSHAVTAGWDRCSFDPACGLSGLDGMMAMACCLVFAIIGAAWSGWTGTVFSSCWRNLCFWALCTHFGEGILRQFDDLQTPTRTCVKYCI